MAPRDFASFGDEPDFREAIAAILAQQSAQPSRGVAGGLTNFATGFGSGLLGAQVRGDRRAEDQEARAITAAILRGENPNLDGLSGRNFGRLAPIVLDQRQRAQRAQQEAAERAEEQAFRRQTRAEDRQFRLEDRDFNRQLQLERFNQERQLAGLRAARPNEFAQRAAAAQQFGVDPNSEEGRRFILSGNIGGDNKPLSEIGRIQADLNAGRISPDQAQLALQQTQRPPTEAQSRNAGFARRLEQAIPIIEQNQAAATNPTQRTLASIPFIGNYLTSPEYQALGQAERNAVNSILRPESGALISDDEFENAKRQYLPLPGDSPEVIAQKIGNLRTTLQGIRNAAGPALIESPQPAAPAAPTAAPPSQQVKEYTFNPNTGKLE